jgi:hypothetical protein
MRNQALLLTIILAPGCGDSASMTGSPITGTTCIRGQQMPCACPGGASSTRICNSAGTGYDACHCSSDGGTSDAAPICAPADVSSFHAPAYRPASGAHQGKCTSTQITGFFTACLASSATNQSCSAFAGSSATQSDRDCAACLYTMSTASQYGPVVGYPGRSQINRAGCLELQGNSACATALQALESCQAAACEANCPITDSNTLQSYLQCAQSATTGGCVNALGQTQCVIPDAGPATTCLSGTSFQDLYNHVAPLFCGSGS